MPERASPCGVLVAILLGVVSGMALCFYGCGRNSGIRLPGLRPGRSASHHSTQLSHPNSTHGGSSPSESQTHSDTESVPERNNESPTESAPSPPSEHPGVVFSPPPDGETEAVKLPLKDHPRELDRGNPHSSEVALTFDAGASGAPTKAILKALDDAGVKATFFLTGQWCEKYPELAKEIVAAGHEIGNHTYDHKELPKLTDQQIIEELQQTDEVVYRATGEHTTNFFRPPFGARDKRVLETAANAGYRSAYWTLDSWDSVKAGITSAQIEQRVVGKLAAGDIVLMHCGSEQTAKALPDIIQQAKAKGYRMVKVSELR